MSEQTEIASKCGTYAGWNAHRYAGEKPCQACREAATEYQRQWRARGGEPRQRARMAERARQRALWRLKDMHRSDFDLLVADEMRVERMAARREGATK